MRKINELVEVYYKINLEGLKDKKLSDYPLVLMMENVSKFQNEVKNLTQNNERQRKILEKTITLAEIVRKISFGRLFFGKRIKEVLGEKSNNVQKLPSTSTLDEI